MYMPSCSWSLLPVEKWLIDLFLFVIYGVRFLKLSLSFLFYFSFVNLCSCRFLVFYFSPWRCIIVLKLVVNVLCNLLLCSIYIVEDEASWIETSNDSTKFGVIVVSYDGIRVEEIIFYSSVCHWDYCEISIIWFIFVNLSCQPVCTSLDSIGFVLHLLLVVAVNVMQDHDPMIGATNAI